MPEKNIKFILAKIFFNSSLFLFLNAQTAAHIDSSFKMSQLKTISFSQSKKLDANLLRDMVIISKPTHSSLFFFYFVIAGIRFNVIEAFAFRVSRLATLNNGEEDTPRAGLVKLLTSLE